MTSWLRLRSKGKSFTAENLQIPVSGQTGRRFYPEVRLGAGRGEQAEGKPKFW